MPLKWSLAQYLEIRWWKRYQRNLDDNYLEKKRTYWVKILDRAGMKVPSGLNILDVGCGPSGVYTILQANKVVGVDPLLNEYAKQIKFFSEEAFPYTTFVAKPFEDFQIEQCYDLVFCLNAINHFRDLHQSIKKLYDSVKPGGELLLGIDGHRHKFLKIIFSTIHMDLLHPMQYTLNEYLGFVKGVGFIVEDVVEYTRGGIFNYYLVRAKKQ